ncbi:MAG: hypothetical protein WA821_16645 [Anaerolineales bacterium]
MELNLRATPFPLLFAVEKDADFDDAPRRTSHASPPPYGNGGNRGGPNNSYGYIDLQTIRPGEMEDSFRLMEPQLIQNNIEEKGLRKNRLYQISLTKNGSRTRSMFGKLQSYSPGNAATINDITSLDVIFFRGNAEPARVQIESEDINRDQRNPVQSYWLKVEAWLPASQIRDFERDKNEIQAMGFTLRYNSGMGVLKNIAQMPKNQVPWIFLVSSLWIEQQNPDIKELVLSKFERLVEKKNRLIINYRDPKREKLHLSLNKRSHILPQGNPDCSYYEIEGIEGILGNLQDEFDRKLASKPLGTLIE